MIHLLMLTYKQPLREIMRMTFPQVLVLLGAMSKQPSLDALAYGALSGLAKNKSAGSLGGMGAVERLPSNEFGKRLRGMVNG